MTGREVGGPSTGPLLRGGADGTLETAVGYETRLPDGRTLRSTTVVLRDADGTPVAALCINADVMIWHAVRAIADTMLAGAGQAGTTPGGPRGDGATTDVDGLARQLLADAVAAAGAPVALMQKRHKIAVVKDLRDRGFFSLKGGVETAAQALDVTRFTVYNYLNELEEQDAVTASGDEART